MSEATQTPFDPDEVNKKRAEQKRQHQKKLDEEARAQPLHTGKVTQEKDTPAARSAAANSAQQQAQPSLSKEHDKKEGYSPQFGETHYQIDQTYKMLEELLTGIFNSLSPGKQAEQINAQLIRIGNMRKEFVKSACEFFGVDSATFKSDKGNTPTPEPDKENSRQNPGESMRNKATPGAGSATPTAEDDGDEPEPPTTGIGSP